MLEVLAWAVLTGLVGFGLFRLVLAIAEAEEQKSAAGEAAWLEQEKSWGR